MVEPCFKKRNSDPPLCGGPWCAARKHQSSEDSALSKLEDFAFLVCPVSGHVVRDSVPQ
jgi:hypothetical protein